MMFINEALAQTAGAAAQSGSISSTLIQLGLIFVIFYFLLIRPQQKKIKQHDLLLTSIKKGDKILTGGGIYAKVIKAEDPIDLTVELADGVVVEINRSTVRDVIDEEQVKAAKAKAAARPANSNKKNKEKK